MKRIALIAAVALGLIAGSADARTAWTPGTAYLIPEQNMSRAWEKTYDHAFCNGIPRFGHSGEFPYEKFRVFDCTLTKNGRYWPQVRVKSVKAKRYGYFRSIVISWGESY